VRAGPIRARAKGSPVAASLREAPGKAFLQNKSGRRPQGGGYSGGSYSGGSYSGGSYSHLLAALLARAFFELIRLPRLA
jgi:uncharacterized membrane protein